MNRLQPQHCCILFVDLQIGSVARVQTPTLVAETAKALIELAHIHSMPVIVTAGQRSDEGGKLIPELDPVASKAIFRTSVDAFETAELAEAVQKAGRKTLIIAGVATDTGVLYAALSAKSADHTVYVVAEGCASTDHIASETGRARLHDAGVTRVGFASLAIGLMGDFASPHAKDTLALVDRLSAIVAKTPAVGSVSTH